MKLMFFKVDCTCKESLFSYKYLRTHRTGGIKLVRCFPHCCPTHSYSTFCSTSISLKLYDTTKNEDLAFIKMQRMEDTVFNINEEIDASIVFSDTRSIDNLKGEWISSQFYNYIEEKNEIHYHFNQNNCLGWHYSWIGTTKKQAKVEFHCLVGYIFSKSTKENRSTLKVTAITISPPFLIMSYRRACHYCQKHRPDEIKTTENQCRCDGELNLKYATRPFRQNEIKTQLKPSYMMPTTQEIENQLIKLYTVLSIPEILLNFIPDIGNYMDEIFLQLNQSQEILNEPRNIFNDFLKPFHFTKSKHFNETTYFVQAVLSLVNFKTIQNNLLLLNHATRHLLDKNSLHTAYEAWIKHHYSVISASLAKVNFTLAEVLHSLNILSEFIPELNEILKKDYSSDSISCGFNYFISQLREIYMATTIKNSIVITPSMFNGRWIFQKLNSKLIGSWKFNILHLLRSFSIGYCFDIKINQNIFHIKSILKLCETKWSIFYLDTEFHIFQIFPNGESTMSTFGQLIHGDYIGELNNEKSIQLEFFSWPIEHSNTKAIRLAISLAIRTNDIMEIKLCMGQTIPNQWIDFTTLSINERRQQYDMTQEEALIEIELLYNRMN